jgi:hypothetical protein
MDFVIELFQYGLTGLDSVLGQLKVIRSGADFEFDLVSGHLSLRYFDTSRNNTVCMSDEQLKDFEQRLTFIRYEEKSAGHDIAGYIAMIERYRGSLSILHELHILGHPMFRDNTMTFREGPVDNIITMYLFTYLIVFSCRRRR